MTLQNLNNIKGAACKGVSEHLAYSSWDEFQRIADLGRNEFAIASHVFVSSNERSQDFVLNSLMAERSRKNGIHIGFSGLFNLDIVARRESSFALIGDYNSNNKLLFDALEVSLKDESIHSRDEFVRVFSRHLLVSDYVENIFPPIDALPEYFVLQLEREQSWLGNDQSFSMIQNMVRDGRLIFAALDITDIDSTTRIRRAAESVGLRIDTLYISNIYDHLSEGTRNTPENELGNIKRTKFNSSIRILSDNQTLLLDTDSFADRRPGAFPTVRIAPAALRFSSDERYFMPENIVD